jgi:hypothetical protein
LSKYDWAKTISRWSKLMKKLISKLLIMLLLMNTTIVAAQTCNNYNLDNNSTTRFVVDKEEVTDKQTGLIWQRCTYAQTGSNCSIGIAQTYTWAQALVEVEDYRKLTGQSWRLPNIKELLSIAEEKCKDPAIDATIFPATLSTGYWSSSPSQVQINFAWAVDFFYGKANSDHRYHIEGSEASAEKYIRLVRTGL